MMGRQVAQGALFYGFRLDEHVPVDHLLRRIDGLLDFGFVHEALAASYSTSGRPSIDPELMLRMLLIGYLFGICSERRLCEEVHLNLAYRWFCRLDLADRVPDRSTFSKNRHGRFRTCDLHRLLFEQVVARCAAAGLVAGREVAVDGSTIMADASREKKLKGADAAAELRAGESISRPVAEYLAALDAALPPDPDEPAPVDPTSISPTDSQAALTCKHGPARYAYAINPLLDLDTDCILDMEACPFRSRGRVRISDPMSLVFVASPAYLKTHRCPKHPDDLGHHRCISYRHTTSGTLHRWEFGQNGLASQRLVPASFVTNDVDVMRDAALSGLGVACLIAEQASPHLLSGNLVEVLPGWGTTLPPNHLYYPSRRQPSAAFRAFLNAMRAS